MSAIWGIISRNGKDHSTQFHKMTETMKQYKIDRFDTLSGGCALFGCGHQYFTQEAISDISPVWDHDNNLLFASDCFLYNRDTLIQELSPYYSFPEVVGDASLAYYAYQHWGNAFVNHLRGSFSVAIYLEEEGTLHLFTDHFCKRYLAFMLTDSFLAFGSTYKPILAIADHPLTLNEQSIIYAFSGMSPLSFYVPEVTSFQGILHLDASMHYAINVATGAITKEQYWDPIHSAHKAPRLSDAEYRELFRDTFQKVCVAHLRSRKETGIMLSGGLDSASVLTMVAPELKKQNKSIYSYTSVPCPTYQAKMNLSVIENESYFIYAQQQFHDNLVPRFIGEENGNCMDLLSHFQELFDLPTKSAQNSFNILRMTNAAVKDDCLILLGGGNGNANISYGYNSTYVGLCISKLQVIKALKEADAFCKRCQIPRSRYFKFFLRDLQDYYFPTHILDCCYLRKDIQHTYHIQQLLRKDKKRFGSSFVTNEKQKLNFMYYPEQYIQKSLFYTTLSLEQGFLQLDPTLSVEMTELCMRMPNTCFAKNGIERCLVRDYLSDLLPPSVLDMRKGYGVQASDFHYRINRDWDRIKDTVLDLLQEPMLFQYLDTSKVNELRSKIEQNPKNLDWNTAWYAVNICSLAAFLRGHRQYTK